MIFQTCRRHPAAGRFLAECSGCKQELFDLQAANERRASERLAAKVRTALGLAGFPAPVAEAGETERRVCVWSVRELQDVFARVGGTVTARSVERTVSDGTTFTAREVTVTVTLPGVGEVQVFTDWDPADEGYGFALPVIRTLNTSAVSV